MTGLVKAKEYKVEDSNVEKLGSAEDRAVKKTSALHEPAWKRYQQYMSGALLTSTEAVKDKSSKPHHVEIWRIEKFKVKLWPREAHGQFHSGDSYIILHTYKEEDKILWDLHFWIGKESSQDEYGTAAYKTVELDTLMDDGPVQHRETQGYESDIFMRLFGEIIPCGGLRYLDGGVDTGFRHVEPEKYAARLMQLKGKKRVRVSQVEVAISSLNSGDVFIFDGGLTVHVWTGKEAGMFEKNKAREVADAVKTERKARCTVVNFREGDGTEDEKEFYKRLGFTGDKPTIKSAKEGGSDEEADKTGTTQLRLLRVSDSTGTLKMTVEAEGANVKKSLLQPEDAFIFDAGSEVFVWIGKGCTDQEKFEAINFGAKYLKDFNRPAHLSLTRILEGSENNVFYSLFPNTK